MADVVPLIQSLIYEITDVGERSPWPSRLFNDDFILISEFSELEGPKPVMTIPDKGGGSFDKNSFAVKVLSVDCNSLSVPGMNLGGFQIVGDTQVVISDVTDAIVSFVYHFTLYDIRARGFVRPFCMAYVKHASDGVLHELKKLNTVFHCASQCLRLGNAFNFLRKLKQRQRYLDALNRYMMTSGQDFVNTKELKNITKAMVDDYCQDTQDLLKIFSKYSDDLLSTQDAKDLNGASQNSLLESIYKASASYMAESTLSDQNDPVKLLEDTSPRSLGITSGRKFDTALHNLKELCDAGYEPCIGNLRNLAETSQFVNKRLQHLDKAKGIFSQDYGLFGIRSLYRTACETTFGPCNEESLTRNQANMSCYEAQKSKPVPVQEVSANGSRESLASLSNSRGSSSGHLQSEFSTDFELSSSYLVVPEKINPCPPLPYSFRGHASSPQSYAYNDPTGWLDSGLFLTETKLTQQVIDHRLKRVDSWSSTCSDAALTPLSSSSFSSLADDISVEYNMVSVRQAELRAGPTPFGIDATLAKLLVKMIRRYSFMPHLIYSILIGRPVVILSDIANEEMVQSIIKILTTFVPDHAWKSSSTVIGWITGPLHISLLAKAKLIGLAKTSGSVPSIPSAVRCYVSVFDVDNLTLLAPSYEGLLLHDLLDSKKDWPTIVAFVEYMHSVGLKISSMVFTKFAAAFASYELGIVEENARTFGDFWKDTDAMVDVNRASAIHCDIHKHDTAIIDSFVNVLKHLLILSDQCGHGSSSVGSNLHAFERFDNELIDVKLNRLKCTLFKASSGKRR